MRPVRLEPAASRSRVKHSTTEPLSSIIPTINIYAHIDRKLVFFFIQFVYLFLINAGNLSVTGKIFDFFTLKT